MAPMTEAQKARKRAQRRTAKNLREGRTGLEDIGEASRGDAFAQGANISDDDFIPFTYDPTRTTWPGNGWDHRRTTQAGYNRQTKTLRIKFYTNGAEYDYYDVPPGVARRFRRVASPGKFINKELNGYSYERIN